LDAFGLPATPHYIERWFAPNAMTAAGGWTPFDIPAGYSMISMLLIGAGGGGGNGVIGAASTAAGGGGGGAGAMTTVTMPTAVLPPRIWVSVAHGLAAAGIETLVSILPNNTANHIIARANGGGKGGNASGATAGSAGNAGTTVAASAMPRGWPYAKVVAGIAGMAGGTTGSPTAASYPANGNIAMGGTGGGGLGAAASTGANGGGINAASIVSPFTAETGGSGGATAATVPPNDGDNGTPLYFMGKPIFFLPGMGGQATHGSATGAGLKQSRGGDGAPGCGGGGMGGALTGSTAATASKGGPGICYITCY